VSLNRGVAASSLRTVSGFAGGAVVDASQVAEDNSRLFVWFVGYDEPLVCLSQALVAEDMVKLVDSVNSAVKSAAIVYPVVAVNSGGNASSGYFCGLAEQNFSAAPTRPASGQLS
jgi:hypothetical protein